MGENSNAMDRRILEFILKRSIGSKCIGESYQHFYNRYPKEKIVMDWLFNVNEVGILYKKRYWLVKPLSKLLPSNINDK